MRFLVGVSSSSSSSRSITSSPSSSSSLPHLVAVLRFFGALLFCLPASALLPALFPFVVETSGLPEGSVDLRIFKRRPKRCCLLEDHCQRQAQPHVTGSIDRKSKRMESPALRIWICLIQT